MRKFTFAFALVCTVAAASMLGACNKNSDKCSDCNKDKAAVQTDAQMAPAGSKSCSGSGSNCAGKCTGEKKTCPATGQSN
jgi:hypothetical protein